MCCWLGHLAKGAFATQAAAQEAVTAQQADVAKCALLELQKLIDEDPAATIAPGDRAVVLSNIVRIIQDTPNQSVKGKATYC